MDVALQRLPRALVCVRGCRRGRGVQVVPRSAAEGQRSAAWRKCAGESALVLLLRLLLLRSLLPKARHDGRDSDIGLSRRLEPVARRNGGVTALQVALVGKGVPACA